MTLPPSSVARPAIPEPIRLSRMIAIARGLDTGRLNEIADALAAVGVGAMEVTLNSDDALASIASLANRFDDGSFLIGAGTVLDVVQAQAAIAAGAGFLVMPHTDRAVIEVAAARDIPIFPGAFTPTEILAAWRAGASAVKVFPASAVGPAFVRELQGPLPHIPVVPTGGVTIESASQFIAAGAVAVGVGGWLTGDGDPRGIADRATLLLAALQAVR